MIGDGRISGHGACGLGSTSGELVIMGSTGISFSFVAAGFVMRLAARRWGVWTWNGGFLEVGGGHVWFRFKKKYEYFIQYWQLRDRCTPSCYNAEATKKLLASMLALSQGTIEEPIVEEVHLARAMVSHMGLL